MLENGFFSTLLAVYQIGNQTGTSRIVIQPADVLDVRAFKTPEVRDLVWILTAPGLIAPDPWWPKRRLADATAADWAVDAEAALSALDQQPTPLHRWLDRHQRGRLGHYAEDLLAWWLHHCPAVVEHAMGVVVPGDDGRTRGELDCLWRAPGQSHIEHWELAVKLYLRTDNRLDGCLGPDPRDSLGAKLRHLHEHQLPLGAHPAAQPSVTKAMPAGGEVRSRVLLKGWLFHPLQSGGEYHRLAPGPVAADHDHGWWARLAKLRSDHLPRRGRQTRYAILPKARWLAPARLPRDFRGLWSADQAIRELRKALSRRRRPELVVAVTRDLDGAWSELERGFVVPDAWPTLPADHTKH